MMHAHTIMQHCKHKTLKYDLEKSSKFHLGCHFVIPVPAKINWCLSQVCTSKEPKKNWKLTFKTLVSLHYNPSYSVDRPPVKNKCFVVTASAIISWRKQHFQLTGCNPKQAIFGFLSCDLK
jgi:hypothetical protein